MKIYCVSAGSDSRLQRGNARRQHIHPTIHYLIIMMPMIMIMIIMTMMIMMMEIMILVIVAVIPKPGCIHHSPFGHHWNCIRLCGLRLQNEIQFWLYIHSNIHATCFCLLPFTQGQVDYIILKIIYVWWLSLSSLQHLNPGVFLSWKKINKFNQIFQFI